MDKKNTTYLEHAYTCFPKAPGIWKEFVYPLYPIGTPIHFDYNLSAHASEIVVKISNKVVYIIDSEYRKYVVYTSVATHELKLAIKGIKLSSKNHVTATCLDHNSILRPLYQIRQVKGLAETVVKYQETDARLEEEVDAFIKPLIWLLVINHATNVKCSVLLCENLIDITHSHGIIVFLDVGLTVGILIFTLAILSTDLIAFGTPRSLLRSPRVWCLIIGNLGITLYQIVLMSRVLNLSRCLLIWHTYPHSYLNISERTLKKNIIFKIA